MMPRMMRYLIPLCYLPLVVLLLILRAVRWLLTPI